MYSRSFFTWRWLLPPVCSCICAMGLMAIGDCSIARANYTLDFVGQIDGSDTIRIEADRAVWDHRYFLWPENVSLNGVSWATQENQELLFGGVPLIPGDLQNYTASVSMSSGRDVAVAEIEDDHLLIHLVDTPDGTDQYAFQVLLTEKPAPTPTPLTTLHLQGVIDGSDRIRITNTEATWIHNYWSVPNAFSLNGIAWDPSSQQELANSGSTRFLPDDIDWSTARLTKHSARDLATLEVFDDRVELIFADNPMGGDLYDVTVTFGSVPEPSIAILGFSALIGMLVLTLRRRRI